MTTNEIAEAHRRLRAHLEGLLAPDELQLYDAYRGRVEEAIVARSSDPVRPTQAEQAVLDRIEADADAKALRAQLDILTRVEVSRQ